MKQLNTKVIYFTTKTNTEVQKIARILVEESLVACVNIIGPSTSIYRWDDEIIKTNEFIAIAKTSSKNSKKSVKRLIELHSYECPAALIVDIETGNEEFISWINKVVK
mgnify:FL=1|tara:strand:+ start:364 stop:687 length:324 start_codon:yes stop_codon:yes gene_type:complete